MTRHPRHLDFTIRWADGHVTEVGSLAWPFGIRHARIVAAADGREYVIELFDTRGLATFSLADVMLSDLEVSR